MRITCSRFSLSPFLGGSETERSSGAHAGRHVSGTANVGSPLRLGALHWGTPGVGQGRSSKRLSAALGHAWSRARRIEWTPKETRRCVRARLESGRDDRVDAQKESARTRLESGRDGAQKESALTRSRLESGRTAPIKTRREHAWSRTGRTELKPKETRRRHTLSRAGLDQNHVRSFSLSFLRQQRDRAITLGVGQGRPRVGQE